MKEKIKLQELTEEELKKVVGGAPLEGYKYRVTWTCKSCGHQMVIENSLDHGPCESCGGNDLEPAAEWL